jgi:signal peptide peptidase SppA
MRSYPHFFSALFCQPLLLHAPARAGFESYLLRRMGSSGSDPIPAKRSDAGGQAQRVARVYEKRGRLGIVRIYGALDKCLSEMEMECFGGCDLVDVDRALAMAEADRQIDTVLLEINSPGGSVTGTPETAARVARLRQSKEVHAFTETMCCSAAYYIASQADHIACTPSSTLGSIGVYIAILDETRAMEIEGLKINLMKAGKFKAMGASFKELTDEERAMLQQDVDRIHADFKAACTALRPIQDGDMQGQWFNGKQAALQKLADETTNKSADEWADELAA